MSKITLDAATAAKLLQAEPATEFIGPDGATLGGFVTPSLLIEVKRLIEQRRAAMEEADREVTLESLIAADQRGGATPHEEIIRRLEQKL